MEKQQQPAPAMEKFMQGLLLDRSQFGMVIVPDKCISHSSTSNRIHKATSVDSFFEKRICNPSSTRIPKKKKNGVSLSHKDLRWSPIASVPAVETRNHSSGPSKYPFRSDQYVPIKKPTLKKEDIEKPKRWIEGFTDSWTAALLSLCRGLLYPTWGNVSHCFRELSRQSVWY